MKPLNHYWHYRILKYFFIMATQAKLALSETVDWKKNTFFRSSITLNESNPEKRYLYSLCQHTFEFWSSFFKFCILSSSALSKYCISSFRMTMNRRWLTMNTHGEERRGSTMIFEIFINTNWKLITFLTRSPLDYKRLFLVWNRLPNVY